MPLSLSLSFKFCGVLFGVCVAIRKDLKVAQIFRRSMEKNAEEVGSSFGIKGRSSPSLVGLGLLLLSLFHVLLHKSR